MYIKYKLTVLAVVSVVAGRTRARVCVEPVDAAAAVLARSRDTVVDV